MLIQTTISISTYSMRKIVQFCENNFKQILIALRGFRCRLTSRSGFPSVTADCDLTASMKIARNFQEVLLILFDDSAQSLYV